MKYLKQFKESRIIRNSETTLNKLANKTRFISDEDDIELVDVFQSLTDMGFRMNRYKNQDYYVGTQYSFSLRIRPEKDLLTRNDSICYYTGGHEHKHKPLNTDHLISAIGDLDRNPKFEMVDDEIINTVYETLDRIGSSKFKIIYFEIRLSNLNHAHLVNNKLLPGEAEIYLFFQMTN